MDDQLQLSDFTRNKLHLRDRAEPAEGSNAKAAHLVLISRVSDPDTGGQK
jgi:hypothetical protein